MKIANNKVIEIVSSSEEEDNESASTQQSDDDESYNDDDDDESYDDDNEFYEERHDSKPRSSTKRSPPVGTTAIARKIAKVSDDDNELNFINNDNNLTETQNTLLAKSYAMKDQVDEMNAERQLTATQRALLKRSNCKKEETESIFQQYLPRLRSSPRPYHQRDVSIKISDIIRDGKPTGSHLLKVQLSPKIIDLQALKEDGLNMIQNAKPQSVKVKKSGATCMENADSYPSLARLRKVLEQAGVEYSSPFHREGVDQTLVVAHPLDNRSDLIQGDGRPLRNINVNGVMVEATQTFRFHGDQNDPLGRHYFPGEDSTVLCVTLGNSKKMGFKVDSQQDSIVVTNFEMVIMKPLANGIRSKMQHAVFNQQGSITILMKVRPMSNKVLSKLISLIGIKEDETTPPHDPTFFDDVFPVWDPKDTKGLCVKWRDQEDVTIAVEASVASRRAKDNFQQLRDAKERQVELGIDSLAMANAAQAANGHQASERGRQTLKAQGNPHHKAAAKSLKEECRRRADSKGVTVDPKNPKINLICSKCRNQREKDRKNYGRQLR